MRDLLPLPRKDLCIIMLPRSLGFVKNLWHFSPQSKLPCVKLAPAPRLPSNRKHERDLVTLHSVWTSLSLWNSVTQLTCDGGNFNKRLRLSWKGCMFSPPFRSKQNHGWDRPSLLSLSKSLHRFPKPLIIGFNQSEKHKGRIEWDCLLPGLCGPKRKLRIDLVHYFSFEYILDSRMANSVNP